MQSLNTIMVIDDSEDDLDLYSRILKKIAPKASITQCTSSKQAMEQLSQESETYDVILLDYSLPGETGLSLLERMGEDVQRRHGPIIMLTGYGNEAIAVKCMRFGARDYIKKNHLSVESLKRSMSNAITKHSAERLAFERECELLVFAQTLSHDLKAPLGRIETYLRILGKKFDLQGNLYYDNIKDDVDYVLLFLRRLGEYTQIGRSCVTMDCVDMNCAVAKSIRNLEVMIERHNASIEMKQLPTVQGDEVALIQLFQNLISNAIQYSVEEPHIVIEAKEKDHTKMIYVHDNGIGVPSENTHEIFEPFKRLHQDGQEHMGLGLALCQKIAQQHKGMLEAFPREGGGSTFCLSL